MSDDHITQQSVNILISIARLAPDILPAGLKDVLLQKLYKKVLEAANLKTKH